jgi:hypothetical protein
VLDCRELRNFNLEVGEIADCVKFLVHCQATPELRGQYNRKKGNGSLLVDEITSKEKGSAHYIAKTQSYSTMKSDKMAV